MKPLINCLSLLNSWVYNQRYLTMFVISIKILFDCSGNRLEKPEYEYFSYDKYAGSFSTGYPTWDDFYHAETFKTAEQAKKVYLVK